MVTHTSIGRRVASGATYDSLALRESVLYNCGNGASAWNTHAAPNRVLHHQELRLMTSIIRFPIPICSIETFQDCAVR